MSPELQEQYWQHLIRVDQSETQKELDQVQTAAQERLQKLRTEEEILAKLQGGTGNPVYDQAFRAAAIVRLAAPDVVAHTEHTLKKSFAPLLEPNPRAMKRMLNAYSVQRAMDILRGGNMEPKKLALWTIASLRWPLLTEYLESRPEMAKLIGEKTLPVGEIPSNLRHLFQNQDMHDVIKGKGVETFLDEDAIRAFAGLRTSNSSVGTVA